MQKLKVAAAAVRNLIGQADVAIADMRKWARLAHAEGVELILFPELNLTGHVRASIISEIAETVPGPSTEKAIRLARETEMTISFGIVEREQGSLYCTHVLVDGAGLIGKQRKIHVPTQEQPYWRAGDAIEVFDIGKAMVGITICRDSFFDEMTRTLYFLGAEVILMPFGYYNVPRSQYLRETIHGMSLIKSAWSNGFFEVVCNSAGKREPSQWEPRGRTFPGWAGIIDPWGEIVSFVERDGNDECLVIAELDPARLSDRRNHPNFLARELRPELYRFS
jgi:predicted amidohydrolase